MIDPNTKLTYSDHTVTAADIAPAGIAYLLQYGFAQSLQDAVAGTAKAVRDVAAACRAGGDGFDKTHKKWIALCENAGLEGADFAADEQVTLVATATVASDMASRFNAILAGEVGTRAGGPRLDPVDRTMRDIAERELREYCRANKVAMVKGKELTDMLAEMIADDESRYRADAEAELAKTKANSTAADRIAGRLKAKTAPTA